MKKVVIVIPIYKQVPSNNEVLSLKRCALVFPSTPILIIHPIGLDLSKYDEIFSKENICKENFDATFFKNTDTYNRLLLDKRFYHRLKDFENLLIYQPDAYVFENNLEYWTGKKYDYIGAPLIKNINNGVPDFIPFGGNGGFSLRNIPACIKTLSAFKIMESPNECIVYFKKFHSGFNLWLRFPLMLLRMLGYRNNSKYYIRNFDANEDVFWSLKAGLIDKNFKVATATEEIPFAFEKQPALLFKMNGNKLPFGCHAWEKHEPEFWKNHIPTN